MMELERVHVCPKGAERGCPLWEGCQVRRVHDSCQEQAAISERGFILTAWPGNVSASH